MTIIEMIPAQVYFMIAIGAGLVFLADTAVRSWKSPERVADPSVMWPRPAPARGELLYGPRLPSGAFRLAPVGAIALRVAQLNERAVPVVSSSGDTFWSMAALAPDRGDEDWRTLRASYGGEADPRYRAIANDLPLTSAEASFFQDAQPFIATDPTEQTLQVLVAAGAAEAVPHEGASLDWSPAAEVAEVEAARLPLDDVDEWLAERLRTFEHALLMIDCRTVWLDRGLQQRTMLDELDAFVAGSQQLHAYREMRIGNTAELDRAAMRRELERV